MITPEEVGVAIAWIQLVFGVVFLVFALRGNLFQGAQPAARLHSRTFAPIGVWFAVVGTFKLLAGHVAETPLIILTVVGLGAAIVWWVRLRRALRTNAPSLLPPDRR